MSKKRILKPNKLGNDFYAEVKKLGMEGKPLSYSKTEMGQQLQLLFRDCFRWKEKEGLIFLTELSVHFKKFNGKRLPVSEIGRLFKRWQVNRSYLKTFFKFMEQVNTIHYDYKLFCDFVEIGKTDFRFGARVTAHLTLYVALINKAIEYGLDHAQLPFRDLQLLRTPDDPSFNRLTTDQQVTQIKREYALLPMLVCEMLSHDQPLNHIRAMMNYLFGQPSKILKWSLERSHQMIQIIDHASIRFLSFSTLDFVMALCDLYRIKPMLFSQNSLAGCDGMQPFLNILLQAYHLPFAVSNNFFFRRSSLDDTELEWCLALIQGESMKNLRSLPVEATRSFIASFNSVACHPDLSLKQAMIHSSLMANNLDADFAHHAVKIPSNSDLNNGKYFVEVVCLANKLGLDTNDLQTTWDYFKHNQDKLPVKLLRRYRRNKLFSDIRDWHMSLYFKKNPWARTPFPKSKIKPYQQATDGTFITIKQIVMPAELYDEGRAMEHCVYAYEGRVRSKDCYIFSLKERDKNSVSKRRLTIEIRANNIVQVRGKRNRTPETKEYGWIKQWAGMNQLNMACV